MELDFNQLGKQIAQLQKEISSGEFFEEILKKLMPEIENGLKQSAETAAGKFYGAYDRKYYDPSESLKNIGKAIPEGKGKFYIYYDSDVFGGHHQNAGVIFNNVFIEGYHGGSSGKGSNGVSWRTPYGIYSRWGRTAAKSESPFNLIQNAFDIIWESEIRPKGEAMALEKLEEKISL